MRGINNKNLSVEASCLLIFIIPNTDFFFRKKKVIFAQFILFYLLEFSYIIFKLSSNDCSLRNIGPESFSSGVFATRDIIAEFIAPISELLLVSPKFIFAADVAEIICADCAILEFFRVFLEIHIAIVHSLRLGTLWTAFRDVPHFVIIYHDGRHCRADFI